MIPYALCIGRGPHEKNAETPHPDAHVVPGFVQNRKQEGREEQQRLPRKRVDPHHWGPNPNQWGTTIPRGPNPLLLEIRFPRWGTRFPHRKGTTTPSGPNPHLWRDGTGTEWGTKPYHGMVPRWGTMA